MYTISSRQIWIQAFRPTLLAPALNVVIKNLARCESWFWKRRVLVIKLSPTVPHKERAIKSAPEYSRLFIKSSFFQKGISMPTIEWDWWKICARFGLTRVPLVGSAFFRYFLPRSGNSLRCFPILWSVNDGFQIFPLLVCAEIVSQRRRNACARRWNRQGCQECLRKMSRSSFNFHIFPSIFARETSRGARSGLDKTRRFL